MFAVFHRLNDKRWLCHFDRSSNWLCIGDYKLSYSYRFIEPIRNTIFSLEKDNLKAIWLKIDLKGKDIFQLDAS